VAITYNNMASNYREWGLKEQQQTGNNRSREFFERALDLNKRALRNNLKHSYDVEATYEYLSEAYASLGDKGAADEAQVGEAVTHQPDSIANNR